jgi:hypothetical protein
MTSDHLDRDGIPLPTGPLEEASGGAGRRPPPGYWPGPPPNPAAAELSISSYGEVAARVAAAGEPRWLIQGLWPADAFGVLAAQEGRQDLGRPRPGRLGRQRAPWLDHFACPTPGPVLVFLGEGGERATVRRIEAIATAKGVHPDQLADQLRYRGSDEDGAGTVLLGVELIGGEIADTRFRIRRRVRSHDSADLGAPLSYAVEVLADDDFEDLEPAARPLCPSLASGS